MSQRTSVSRLVASPTTVGKLASPSRPTLSKTSTAAKRVSINPNPVTIPATADQTPIHTTTTTTSTTAATTVKGTIPVADTADPKKVKNVIVSVASPVATEHSYANNDKGNPQNATGKTDSSTDTSSSTSSESSSSEDSDTEDLQHVLNAAAMAASQLSGTAGKKKKGRPRKSTPQHHSTTSPVASTPKSASSSAEANGDSKNRKRGRGCGSCPGCLRDDCGKCQYCVDKPKFGGPGRKKQRCSLRVCSNFVAAPGVKNSTHTPEAAMLASTGAQIAAASVHALATPTRPVKEIKQSAITTSAPPPPPAPAPSPVKKQTKTVATQPPPPSSSSAVTPTPPSAPQPKSSQNFRSSQSNAAHTDAPASSSPPSTAPPTAPATMMKCYQCGRERKLSIARTTKFCTQRCLKQWEERHEGVSPDDAEPVSGTVASELFLPPSGPSRTTPRAVRNLRIDMAYPGTVLQHTGEPPASIPAAQVNPDPEPAEPSMSNGVKRASQEVAAIPSKKAKEVADTSPAPTKGRKKAPTEPYNLPVDVRKWSVKDVTHYFDSTLDCRQYSAMLEEQEVDGPALLLVTSDTLVKCLGIKLGPALKVMMHVERLKAQQQALLS